jgi:hypothetical protein
VKVNKNKKMNFKRIIIGFSIFAFFLSISSFVFAKHDDYSYVLNTYIRNDDFSFFEKISDKVYYFAGVESIDKKENIVESEKDKLTGEEKNKKIEKAQTAEKFGVLKVEGRHLKNKKVVLLRLIFSDDIEYKNIVKKSFPLINPKTVNVENSSNVEESKEVFLNKMIVGLRNLFSPLVFAQEIENSGGNGITVIESTENDVLNDAIDIVNEEINEVLNGETDGSEVNDSDGVPEEIVTPVSSTESPDGVIDETPSTGPSSTESPDGVIEETPSVSSSSTANPDGTVSDMEKFYINLGVDYKSDVSMEELQTMDGSSILLPEFVIIYHNEILLAYSDESFFSYAILKVFELNSVDGLKFLEKEITLDAFGLMTEDTMQKDPYIKQLVEDIDIAELEKYGGTNVYTKKQRAYSSREWEDEIQKENEEKEKEYGRVQFVRDFYLSGNYLESFDKIADKVYYFESALLSEKIPTVVARREVVKGDGFVVLDKTFYSDKLENLFVFDFVFSQSVERVNLSRESFVFENKKGELFYPDDVLVDDKEILLVFSDKNVKDAYLVNINALDKRGDGTVLDGYISLLQGSDDYLEKTASINNTYEAYVGDDIQFSAPKMSFGVFNSAVETDSTISIEMDGTNLLDPSCMMLVFGNDLEGMEANNSGDVIPTGGLTLLTKSIEEVPVDDVVIKDFENEKMKKFLGFVYFKDLEIINNKAVLFLNLTTPGGLSRGKYQTVMSFEVFCPEQVQ